MTNTKANTNMDAHEHYVSMQLEINNITERMKQKKIISGTPVGHAANKKAPVST